MIGPAQMAKSVTHVPGRKCNPCIGTFRKRIKSEPEANQKRHDSEPSAQKRA